MRPQRPVAHDDGDCEERHGDEAYGEVGDGKREEKVVADGLQLLVDLKGDHDHAVADDSEHGEDGGDDGDDDHLRDAEAVGMSGRLGGRRRVAVVYRGSRPVGRLRVHLHVRTRNQCHTRCQRRPRPPHPAPHRTPADQPSPYILANGHLK